MNVDGPSNVGWLFASVVPSVTRQIRLAIGVTIVFAMTVADPCFTWNDVHPGFAAANTYPAGGVTLQIEYVPSNGIVIWR